ncbi:MAG: Hsp20/alpha crystallin family protein [Bradymonadales bacterium]|nr:Hsp20/alpha crystallin family protein [Bradymonadales bacterium]
MITRWTDWNRLFGWPDYRSSVASMENFRRQMNRLFEDWDQPTTWEGLTGWPHTNLYDAGDDLVVTAEVPGLTNRDIEVSVHQNLLSISGERRTDVPEGYTVHRRERTPFKFARSFSLPYKVEPEKATAEVKDGILTIKLSKSPESKPRQITVQAK